MKIRNILAPMAALSLAASPAVAQTVQRDAAPITAENELAGNSAAIPILFGLVLVGITYLIAESDDDDNFISV
ncbi:hypothetical protein G7A66_05635 [Altererythrobacter sp. SALINAS58]|uniref:hypothetical protein n=1 Tax=Alteripontixanthobacter muriae TaxID=2705546 RepID=UPI001576100C|nr:hypothetical protein [Alteripontixanthobacter muriae]NTZ42572.1 hypothetical protein [Alteripontixanthobacter muriae]